MCARVFFRREGTISATGKRIKVHRYDGEICSKAWLHSLVGGMFSHARGLSQKFRATYETGNILWVNDGDTFPRT